MITCAVVGWIGLGAGALFVVGCGDSCAELQTVCDGCLDPNQRAACEAAVDSDNDESCQRDLDSYEDICP